MSDPTGYQQWIQIVPAGGSVWQELQDGEWIVACYAPTEPPPPPPPPPARGEVTVLMADRTWLKLDLEVLDGAFIVHDADLSQSLDEEVG